MSDFDRDMDDLNVRNDGFDEAMGHLIDLGLAPEDAWTVKADGVDFFEVAVYEGEKLNGLYRIDSEGATLLEAFEASV